MMYKVQVRFLFHSDIKIKIPEIYDDSVFDKLFGILEDVNDWQIIWDFGRCEWKV